MHSVPYEWHTCSMCMRGKADTLSVQDNVATLKILSKDKPSFTFYWLQFPGFPFYKHITTMCSSIIFKFMQPENLNRKATDCNFLCRYKYSFGSWQAIETNMATKYFYYFLFTLLQYQRHNNKRNNSPV